MQPRIDQRIREGNMSGVSLKGLVKANGAVQVVQPFGGQKVNDSTDD